MVTASIKYPLQRTQVRWGFSSVRLNFVTPVGISSASYRHRIVLMSATSVQLKWSRNGIESTVGAVRLAAPR